MGIIVFVGKLFNLGYHPGVPTLILRCVLAVPWTDLTWLSMQTESSTHSVSSPAV